MKPTSRTVFERRTERLFLDAKLGWMLTIMLISTASPARSETALLPVGVCDLPAPGTYVTRTASYPEYVHELFRHAGLGYSRFALDKLPEALPSLRVLITAGNATLPEATATALEAWLTQGGVLISVGGLCGPADWYGVLPDHPSNIVWHGDQPVTLGEGYLATLADSGTLAPAMPFPLHFFNGIAVRPGLCRVLASVLDAHQRPTSRAGMTEYPHGKGRCILMAADIIGAVVRIQQGTEIVHDHIPAPDGSAPLTDGVLITEDAMALDWSFDRHLVPGAGEMMAFTKPIADCWRDLLLRTVLRVAEQQRAAVPVLWYYPRNLPALGHLSHDSDGNDPAGVIRMLENLEKAQVHSTWCIMLPGYTPDLIQRVLKSGHELATHYDAYSDFKNWRQDNFSEQVDKLAAMFEVTPVSNKNHVLRWEGDTEFFGWCEAKGIRMDQSKGPCQTGEAGFLFGTSHPYRPVSVDGKIYNVFELPTTTQDLIMTTPISVGDMILDGVFEHYGIAHFLFHPAHSTIPAVADAMLYVLAKGKERGLEWWTARDISAWENARLSASWSGYSAKAQPDHGEATVSLHTEQPLNGATVLWLTPAAGKSAQSVERWGVTFAVSSADVQPGKETVFPAAW